MLECDLVKGRAELTIPGYRVVHMLKTSMLECIEVRGRAELYIKGYGTLTDVITSSIMKSKIKTISKKVCRFGC